MRKYLVLLCMMVGLQAVAAEIPTVPNSIDFAGLNLKLSDKARKKIQAEVNALTRHSKYYQIKVDRLQIYFPIIERVFREEGLPEDFKYLVLQESGLISDAVSTSNAVGFWQFKQATAHEVGLRVDRSVDERLNIVASTRGAAKYIKKNNRLYFDNWVHALLAYQQGPGGAQRLVKKKYQGSHSMPIDGQTHWYVIKFLAHKIAFEQVKSAEPKLYLVEYYEGQGKSLKEIAQIHRLDQEQVDKYNKWLKHGKVPGDKPYAVILPYEKNPNMLASSNKKGDRVTTGGNNLSSDWQFKTHPTKYPVIKTSRNPSKGIKINGIKGIRLIRDMDLETLEQTTGVSVKRLLYYNDATASKKPRAGELWYLKSKRSKAREAYHVVEAGEDLWTISQKYGIRLSKLRQKNRIGKKQQSVKPGRVLWLQSARPKAVPVAYVSTVPESSIETESREAITRERAPSTTGSKPGMATPKTERATPTVNEKHEKVDVPTMDKPVNAANSPKMLHVVEAGETLYGISKKYQVTVEELRRWNNLSQTDALSIGQQIQIHQSAGESGRQTAVSEETTPGFELYQVKSGDTLYQIARDHGATIKELMEWNQKSDFNLSIGEELKIRKLP